MKTDNKGRITNVSRKDKIFKGHSVCVTCGKDMPVCWDTVCYKCRNTSCYNCSTSSKNFWYCKKCKPI